MAEPESGAAENLPVPVTKELRTLAHDLSNSIETIMQASYLLSQAELKDGDRRWLTMIETAVQDAARINRQLREVLRGQSE